MAEPTVSVIVPAYEAGPYLLRCLRSLAAARPSPTEVIVVADGESDGAWRIAPDHGARVVQLPTRRGAAPARNAGAEVAIGEILLFIDADVAVSRDTIGRVQAIFAAAGAPDAVFGSYDDSPAEPDVLSQYRNLLHHHVHQSGHEDASTFFSACGAFRNVGGFRSVAIEDVDLGYRLSHSGYRIRLDKTLQVKHLKRWRPLRLIKTDTIDRALSWTLLLLENPSRFRDDLNLRREGRASLIVLFILMLLLGAAMIAPTRAGWSLGSWLTWAGACLSALSIFCWLNRVFYRFLLRRRGAWFLIAAFPWHMVYYLCGGTGFVLGCVTHLWRQWRTAGPRATAYRG
jgi:glycosyltransferase involved in cell wall biosynthesis